MILETTFGIVVLFLLLLGHVFYGGIRFLNFKLPLSLLAVYLTILDILLIVYLFTIPFWSSFGVAALCIILYPLSILNLVYYKYLGVKIPVYSFMYIALALLAIQMIIQLFVN